MTTNTTTSGVTRLSLLERARARDAAAWSELVRLYAPLLAHWCRQCGLDGHDAADCIQEVFAAAAQSLETYRPRAAHGSFRAWLWTITRNKVRDHFRRKFRQPQARGGSSARLALAAVPDGSAVPDEEPSDAAQVTDLVRRGLAQVQNEFESISWQAFWRTAVDGIPTAVVAAQLGLTTAAVRQHRSRVTRRLRQQLGDSG